MKWTSKEKRGGHAAWGRWENSCWCNRWVSSSWFPSPSWSLAILPSSGTVKSPVSLPLIVIPFVSLHFLSILVWMWFLVLINQRDFKSLKKEKVKYEYQNVNHRRKKSLVKKWLLQWYLQAFLSIRKWKILTTHNRFKQSPINPTLAELWVSMNKILFQSSEKNERLRYRESLTAY